jgi:predicted MFS family arabinose efflux permease
VPDGSPVRTYRSLFAVREFRALWTSSALTTAATTMSGLALATVVHAETGSALLTALAMFGPSVAQVVGATTLMSAADAAPPRRALTVVGVLSASALAAQAVLPLATPGRLALVLGAAYVTSVGGGVRWGLLSEVVPQDGYALARSTMNVAVGVFQVVGFAVGGLLLALLDADRVFVLAAVLAAAAVPVLRAGVAERPPRRTARAGVRETLRANRVLLAGRDTRTLLLALAVPNGLVVGCEALFVPYAGDAAGWLLAGAAAGMLTGDVLGGRVLGPAGRRRASTPLRVLLAAPYLLFVLQPSVPVAVAVAAVASVGYAASLVQQEWLVVLTPPQLRGQALGVESAVRMTLQGVCAAVAGALADLSTPASAITALAVVSLLVSAALTRPLARTGARAASAVGGPRAGLRG